MKPIEQISIESDAIIDFDKVMRVQPLANKYSEGHTLEPSAGHRGRLDLDADKVKNGLGQLVLTLVKLLHELLERQAVRRIEAGSLSDEEIERLGVTLMKQSQELERLRKEFNLEEEDLNLDLGPLGKLL